MYRKVLSIVATVILLTASVNVTGASSFGNLLNKAKKATADVGTITDEQSVMLGRFVSGFERLMNGQVRIARASQTDWFWI